MADQHRNRSKQGNPQSQHGGRIHDEDHSTSMGESRGRSRREPGSQADDRGMSESRRNMHHDNADELDREMVESDLDAMEDLDDIDDGGSER